MKFSLSIILLIILSSCSEQGMEGLWSIQSVSVGDMSMTPNSKWIALAPDNTQVSGNGYLRHSSGSWLYNPADSTLSIEDINGIEEDYGPFKVDYQLNNMTWTRAEDGNFVTVNLVRVNDIPPAATDSLIGLWDLTKAIRNGRDVTMELDTANNAFVHFRWDRNFRQSSFDSSEDFGVYHPHGHRPTLNLISAGSTVSYGYDFSDDDLILSQTNPGDTLAFVFTRTNKYPD
ncbi:MAG: hypothetical protein HKN09_12990 [Saprospiraceae bacterium]|nr:hypothetical protein [Saprospiraceae bacterium]